jgi:hypothetical protein
VLNAVTLAPLTVVSTSAGNPLTLLGSIVNQGTLSANGDPFFGVPGTLLIGGTVALSGGGTLATAEASINANGTAALLDNINNAILGYGSIGAGNNLLKLRNEAAGVSRPSAPRWCSIPAPTSSPIWGQRARSAARWWCKGRSTAPAAAR